jgi:hypothetical protein
MRIPRAEFNQITADCDFLSIFSVTGCSEFNIKSVHFRKCYKITKWFISKYAIKRVDNLNSDIYLDIIIRCFPTNLALLYLLTFIAGLTFVEMSAFIDYVYRTTARTF